MRGVRPPAREKRAAAGAAQRKLAVCPLEANAAAGQCVDIWRLYLLMAVAVQVAVQVIGDQKEDIRLAWGIGGMHGGHAEG